MLDPVDALALLKRAWDSGRPIVPLFGAGLSMEAGIPGTSALAEYLAKVKYLKNPHDGDSEPHGSHLARFGLDEWPGFFEVNRLILSPQLTGHDVSAECKSVLLMHLHFDLPA